MNYCSKCFQLSMFDLGWGECGECVKRNQQMRKKYLPLLYQFFYEKMCELTHTQYCPITIEYHEADFLVALHKYHQEGVIEKNELQEFMETYINATNHLKTTRNG